MGVTVNDVIDAVFRNWIEPADAQPVTTTISGITSTSDTAATLDMSRLAAEEITMLGLGTLIEHADSGELMRLVALNESTGEATLVRARNGTTAAATITDGDEVRIDPVAPRRTVFDAVAGEVSRLSPRLYVAKTVSVFLDSVTALEDSAARGILHAYDDDGERVSVHFRRRHDLADGGPAIVVHPEDRGRFVTVTYRAAIPRPTAATDDLTDPAGSFQLEDEWLEVVEVGAAARVLMSREARRLDTEFLTAAIAAQGVDLGQVTNVATALLRYQAVLIAQHQEVLADTDEPFWIENEVL